MAAPLVELVGIALPAWAVSARAFLRRRWDEGRFLQHLRGAAGMTERIPLANGLVLLIGTEPGMVNPPPEFVRPRKERPDVTATLTEAEAAKERGR